VGTQLLVPTSTLPMWFAVPLTSKSRTFSHSLGRKRPFILAVFEVSERPVRRKADVQIVIQSNRLVNGWIKSPNNQYGPQLGPPVYFSGPANSDNIALRPDLATSD